MGKKDKRRNKLKQFVQKKQKQELFKNGLSLLESNNSNTLHIQPIIHNLNTTSSSSDDRTITESTPLNAVTDSYESITPVNNSVNNSPPPQIHETTTTNTNNMCSTISIHESAHNSTSHQSTEDVVTGTPVLPPSRQASLAPVDSIDPEIQNVETIPALDLNHSQPGTNNTSTISIRSKHSITITRKWLSIALIYLVAVNIGCDLGNVWLYQSKISSQFQQLYNTLQLLLFYVLGFWIQGHFQYNLSIRASVMIVSYLQIITFIIMTLTNSFQIILISRLVAGLATGIFISESLKYFESIGTVNYKVPFHVLIGLLVTSLIEFNNWQCFPSYLVGSSIFGLIGSYVILPSKKDDVELPSHIINKKNTILLMDYILCQFVLTFTNISYSSFILLLLVVPLYVCWDKGSKNCQLLLDRHQDKRNIILRVVILLFTTVVLYSLPIYLDIFDQKTSIIRWILFGGLAGMMLLKTPFKIVLSVLVVDLLAIVTVISVSSDAHSCIKLLITIGIICLTILSLNVKPLQKESHNNFTFEFIIVVIGLIVADLFVHGYTKCLIHAKLMKLVSKKHSYYEIVKTISHSDRSMDWIKNKSPKYAFKAIKASYKKSLHITESVAVVLFALAFVLNIITK
ncbi:hypothetical protein MOUN0_I07580 [Monosporozyma unispora]|nr:hypothetical protein C6P44_002653 [Kazachstania unispora]